MSIDRTNTAATSAHAASFTKSGRPSRAPAAAAAFQSQYAQQIKQHGAASAGTTKPAHNKPAHPVAAAKPITIMPLPRPAVTDARPVTVPTLVPTPSTEPLAMSDPVSAFAARRRAA